MRKSRVSIQYKVSDVFLKSLALAIYQLTISEKDVKTLCQIFEYVVKHRRQRLESFTVKRSEEHTSELQSLMRISYAVFCLKKKKLYNYQNKIYSYTQHRHHK